MKSIQKRFGELVLRTSEVETLANFYLDIIGLEPFSSFGNNHFFKVADDFEGHPQLLAIFEKSKEFSGPRNIRQDDAIAGAGTLHHFAFALEREDFELEKVRLQALGIELQFEDFEQFGWHSMFLYDPDGNSVEFVCYDASLLNMDEFQRVRNVETRL